MNENQITRARISIVAGLLGIITAVLKLIF
jgi:hypothetical protein